MKNTIDDDSITKALQERYTRILGVGEFKARAESKGSRLPWYVGFLITVIAAAALGAWSFFRPPVQRTIAVALAPSATEAHQPNPASPEQSLQTEAGQAKLLISEPAVSNAQVGEPPKPTESGALTSLHKQRSPSGSLPPNKADKASKPAAALVVLLSTTSKEEAIARAKELINRGNLGEVILSTTGYYGVVLLRHTYAQAQAASKALVASGAAKATPYIMPEGRVKAHIYPERPEGFGQQSSP